MMPQFALALVLSLVPSQSALATADQLTFLGPNEFRIENVLAPPPKEDSDVDKRDYAKLHAEQARRTEQDCERASYIAKISLNSLFGPRYGPLSSEEVAKWSTFFEKVHVDLRFFLLKLKDHWGRRRPFVKDTTIKPCIPLELSPAYPSGHAAISLAYAELLSELAPARRQALMERAEQIASDRVLGGVHHPSDLAAGKIYGQAMLKTLRANRKFTSAFRALAR